MWRLNTRVQYICIILMVFNCSVSAEYVRIAKASNGASDVPTASLFVINGNKETTNVKTDNSTSFQYEERSLNLAYKLNINESSQQNVRNLERLSKLPVNHLENSYENSETRSNIESQRHKRTTEQDLCSTSECQCKTEALQFLTVDCNFRQVSILFLLFSIGFCYSSVFILFELDPHIVRSI